MFVEKEVSFVVLLVQLGFTRVGEMSKVRVGILGLALVLGLV